MHLMCKVFVWVGACFRSVLWLSCSKRSLATRATLQELLWRWKLVSPHQNTLGLLDETLTRQAWPRTSVDGPWSGRHSQSYPVLCVLSVRK